MEEINPELLNYIKECRKLGYEDWQIRAALDYHGWKDEDAEKGFDALRKEKETKLKKKELKNNKTIYVYRNSYTVHLDSEVAKIVEKRAGKNILTPEQQIEDIVRRSCVCSKKKDSEIKDNVDDIFLKLFSRKNTGKKK